jgi:hypothetical protein
MGACFNPIASQLSQCSFNFAGERIFPGDSGGLKHFFGVGFGVGF